MTNFKEVQNMRIGVDEKGLPIVHSWKNTINNYLSKSSFINVTPENQDIATEFYNKGLQQYVFDKAARIRKSATRKDIPHHILKVPLKEDIVNQIANVQDDTQKELKEAEDNLKTAFDRQFSFEMLDKYDPKGMIMGLYTSCCCTITSTYYGAKIAEVSATMPDVQHLIVRDKKDRIIAKGTMYVNSEERYAVINDFEFSSQKSMTLVETERYKKQLFDTLMRGVKAFVEEFDRENPENPMQMVTVGIGYNKFWDLLEGNKKLDLEECLKVPDDYSFCDAECEQVVLYDRNEVNTAQENNITTTITDDKIINDYVEGN